MATWDLLGPAEKELHEIRLMGVEKKQFLRITDQIKISAGLIANLTSTGDKPQFSPPPNFDLLKESLTLDFAGFDNGILRLQFNHDANIRERERYHVNQERILQETQAARTKNTELRQQLEASRATLAQRKKFDEMADKITSNRMLRPREEQVHSLSKLEEECSELERESETYKVVWNERRDQFNKIMEEGMQLRRQIRDEKEEVDRREGMDDNSTRQTPGPEGSRNNTPAPDGGAKAAGSETPLRPTSSGATPAPQEDGDQLSAPKSGGNSRSRSGSHRLSPQPPRRPAVEDEVMDDAAGESRLMADASTPSVVIEAPDRMDVDN